MCIPIARRVSTSMPAVKTDPVIIDEGRVPLSCKNRSSNTQEKKKKTAPHALLQKERRNLRKEALSRQQKFLVKTVAQDAPFQLPYACYGLRTQRRRTNLWRLPNCEIPPPRRAPKHPRRARP